tara:strand:- start:171 stop:1529 length:1359 start_codon:yes stop_codon:yes gene_type:complete
MLGVFVVLVIMLLAVGGLTGFAVDGAEYPCSRCPDLNLDGVVTEDDTFLIIARYNTLSSHPDYASWFDLSDDGIIDETDGSCVQNYLGVDVSTVSVCENSPGDCVQCPDLNNDALITDYDLNLLVPAYDTSWDDADYDFDLDMNRDTVIDDSDWNCIEHHIGGYVEDIPQCKFRSSTCYQCPDVNDDGEVNVKDNTEIANIEGTVSVQGAYHIRFDLNLDKRIDSFDQECAVEAAGRSVESLPVCTPTRDTCLQCPDVDADGTVNLNDLKEVRGNEGLRSTNEDYRVTNDQDLNGVITSRDRECVRLFLDEAPYTISQCTVRPETCTVCPDINGDGSIDELDQGLVSKKLGLVPTHNNYDSSLDLNQDDRIDVLDLKCVTNLDGADAVSVASCSGITTDDEPVEIDQSSRCVTNEDCNEGFVCENEECIFVDVGRPNVFVRFFSSIMNFFGL